MFLWRVLGVSSSKSNRSSTKLNSKKMSLGDFLRKERGLQPMGKDSLPLHNNTVVCDSIKSNKNKTVMGRKATILAHIGAKADNNVHLRTVANSVLTSDWYQVTNDDWENDDFDCAAMSDSEESVTAAPPTVDCRMSALETQIQRLNHRIQSLESENANLTKRISNTASHSKHHKTVKPKPRQKLSGFVTPAIVQAIKHFKRSHLNKVDGNSSETKTFGAYVMVPTRHAFKLELAKKVRNPSLKRVKHILESRTIVDPHAAAIAQIEKEMSETKLRLRPIQTVIILD